MEENKQNPKPSNIYDVLIAILSSFISVLWVCGIIKILPDIIKTMSKL